MYNDYLRNAQNNLSDYCDSQVECECCPFNVIGDDDCELWTALFLVRDLIRINDDRRFLEVY